MSRVINHTTIIEIKQKLKSLPKVERVKTYKGQEALKVLQKDIKSLWRKGYDARQIAALLKQEGLSTSTAKIRRILLPPKEANENAPGTAAPKPEERPAEMETILPDTPQEESKKRKIHFNKKESNHD